MRKAGSHSHPTPIPAVLQLRPGARAQDNHPTNKPNVSYKGHSAECPVRARCHLP